MTRTDMRSDRAATRGDARSITSPPRGLDLLPTGALVLAFSIKALLQPRAVRDVFSNTQAFAVAFGILVTWVLLWFVLRRFVRNGWLRTIVLAIAAGFLIWWLVVSALVDKKVVETLPGARSASEQEAHRGELEPANVGPVLVARSAFHAIEHEAMGTATLYREPDGSWIVGLEQFDIEPGPDYRVYVVPGSNSTEPGDDGVYLDRLRGNQGTQFYEVPADTDISPGSWTVLIWCRAFAVPIANATPI